MKNRHLYSHFQLLVQDFHAMANGYTGEWPHIPPAQIRTLRINLLREELGEFIKASDEGDLIEVADALGDLLYVTYGAALAWGISMAPIEQEIHRSNMTKTVLTQREDGKSGKVEGKFSPPDLEPLLLAQVPDESRE